MTRLWAELAIAVIALGCVAIPVSAGAVDVSGVVKLSSEIDTNPDRVVGAPARAVGVGALFSSVDIAGPVGAGGLLRARGQLGSRVHGAASDRDELVASVDATWRHFTPGAVFFGVSGSARDRVERTSTWDYTSLAARGVVGVDVGMIRATIEPTASRFVYRPQPDLDRVGSGGRARMEIFASDTWVTSAYGGVERRTYAAERCCDGRTGDLAVSSRHRVDRLSHGGGAVAWSGRRARLELGLGGWRNRSNSASRGWTRMRADAALTANPFGDLVARLAVVVQRTRFDDDVQVDDDLTIDDDNRNRLAITVDHPVGADWFVEASMRHLIEDFGAGASFSRSVIGFGVAWRPSTR